MGIIMLPPKRYRCSKCGSENCTEFSEPPKTMYAGHYEGVRCRACGHESKHYVQSIFEMESGTNSAWSHNSKPIEF